MNVFIFIYLIGCLPIALWSIISIYFEIKKYDSILFKNYRTVGIYIQPFGGVSSEPQTKKEFISLTIQQSALSIALSWLSVIGAIYQIIKILHFKLSVALPDRIKEYHYKMNFKLMKSDEIFELKKSLKDLDSPYDFDKVS